MTKIETNIAYKPVIMAVSSDTACGKKNCPIPTETEASTIQLPMMSPIARLFKCAKLFSREAWLPEVCCLGFVRTKLVVSNHKRTKEREVTFLADSGSWYTVITPSLTKELDITPITKAKVLTADKRKIETDLAVAYVKTLGREAAVFMAIMEAPEPLIGVEAMEALGISIDPTTGAIKPTRPYGLLM